MRLKADEIVAQLQTGANEIRTLDYKGVTVDLYQKKSRQAYSYSAIILDANQNTCRKVGFNFSPHQKVRRITYAVMDTEGYHSTYSNKSIMQHLKVITDAIAKIWGYDAGDTLHW